MFKPMPSEELMKEVHAHSAAHFFHQADAGTHAGRELLKPVSWKLVAQGRCVAAPDKICAAARAPKRLSGSGLSWLRYLS